MLLSLHLLHARHLLCWRWCTTLLTLLTHMTYSSLTCVITCCTHLGAKVYDTRTRTVEFISYCDEAEGSDTSTTPAASSDSSTAVAAAAKADADARVRCSPRTWGADEPKAPVLTYLPSVPVYLRVAYRACLLPHFLVAPPTFVYTTYRTHFLAPLLSCSPKAASLEMWTADGQWVTLEVCTHVRKTYHARMFASHADSRQALVQLQGELSSMHQLPLTLLCPNALLTCVRCAHLRRASCTNSCGTSCLSSTPR